MLDIWCIFWIKQCIRTKPPKDKWVVIVCIDGVYKGFFINKGINDFVKKRPFLLASQVLIKKDDYGFLIQDSYIDCQKLYDFSYDDLDSGRGKLLTETIKDIKKVVKDSETLEKRYINMIMAN